MPPVMQAPYYLPTANEDDVFEKAWRGGLAIMVKGPTGCGKTRFVEHMAFRLGVPLFTVSCHEDITASDLIGRHLLIGDETRWQDGPLTQAVRQGGIFYLDEVVEARQDAIVAIHPLTDHRREMTIERLGGLKLSAPDGFALVVSYNPGYQSVLKDLKMSTRQRMVAIELGFPPPESERAIIVHETGVPPTVADDFVNVAVAIRRLEDSGLREVASTRTLVAAAILVSHGLQPLDAGVAAIAAPLTDDAELQRGLVEILRTYLT